MFLAALFIKLASCTDEHDIGLFVGNKKWWYTSMDLDEFSKKAQDPEYVYDPLMPRDLRFEHFYDSMLESKYLRDTSSNRFDDPCAGFTNEDVIKLLVSGGDFTKFRSYLDGLICGEMPSEPLIFRSASH